MAERTCSIDGCAFSTAGRGWCSKHYYRWRRYGDPMKLKGRSQPRPRLGPDDDGVDCPHCDGRYSNKKSLGKHMRRLHKEALAHACSHCDSSFGDKRGLQTHMGHSHPESVVLGRNNPRVQRDWNLRTRYGITADQYDQMLKDQGGECATCDRTEADCSHGRLSVDHCHETGQVRGLLCGWCNRAIGLVGDDQERLLKMAEYVSK